MARMSKALWPDDQVIRLVLRNKNLTEWPDGLERLTRLEQLHVEDNRLGDVTPALTRLPALYALSLARNPIAEFPDSIMSQLAGLIKLDLSGTEITTLPPSLASCQRLNRVSLQGMPADFDWPGALELLSQLPRLISLGMGHNRFDTPPAGLARLRGLRMLYLNECGLTSLPAEIAGLGQLEVLSLWKNQLEAVPDEIAGMPSLGSLVISKNPGTRRMKHRLLKLLQAQMLIS